MKGKMNAAQDERLVTQLTQILTTAERVADRLVT
jgi:hypothetical protein